MLKVCVRGLVNRAASGFARIDVTVVSAIPRISQVRERFLVGFIVDVHTIPNSVVRETGKCTTGQDSSHCPRRDVGDVSGDAPSIWEAGSVASQQAHTLPC